MGDVLPCERPLGAHPAGDGAFALRCWAPGPETVAVRVGDREHALSDVGGGVYETIVPAHHGEDYVFVLDGEPLPDPASRWQPDGLRGPSRLLDPGRFEHHTGHFESPPLQDLVIYELHVGTFSAEGTFESAIPHLDELAALGVNAIEVMPVAEFPGTRGWGYDGVYLSAPQSSYGGPLAFQRLVDAAHGKGLAVILDVVYNHVGASGNAALAAFGPYHTDKHETLWGHALDFGCAAVREWVLQSAEQWIRDYRVDGLRLDAIHAIVDTSAEHIVAAVAGRAHAAGGFVTAEPGPEIVEAGAWGCDAAWADDFHHALHVLLTGETDGYYADFGRVADLARALQRAEDEPPLVVFSANHDQVGNRALGDRLPDAVRPLAAFCTLLSPFTPLIFMGDEYGERAPFQFFTDHIDADIADATREGRRREFAAFADFADADVPDPQDPDTFLRSKLTRERDAGLERLHRELIAARRDLPAGDAEITFDEAGRWLRVRRGDRTLVANFATEPMPIDATEIIVATHPVTDSLPPLAGALIR